MTGGGRQATGGSEVTCNSSGKAAALYLKQRVARYPDESENKTCGKVDMRIRVQKVQASRLVEGRR